MSKTVRKVFLIVGTLVFVFLVWQLVFNDGGIIKTVYNAFVDGVNGQWHKAAGDDSDLLPHWDESKAEDNGKGFDIDTGGGN